MPAAPARLSYAARVLSWAAFVLGTGTFTARLLPSRGETFWILVPLWTLAGAWLVRVIPPPRLEVKRRWQRAAVACVLVLFPVGFHVGLVRFAGARASLSEALIAVYFFAVSLEIVLIYFFQGVSALVRACRAYVPGRSALLLSGTARLGAYAVLIPSLLATLSVHRTKILPVPIDPALGIAYEEVSFSSAGERPMRLRGWFIPVEKPVGAVLACHGVGANRADILEVLFELHAAGFQVLAFDFRGHGESAGHTVTFGARERDDVLGAWSYLLSRPEVDRQRVFAFGVSMGAASLLLALPDMPEARAAVIDSSFADLHSMARRQIRFLPAPLDEAMARAMEGVGWLLTGAAAWSVSPGEALERIRIPLAFYHGADDSVIPPEHSKRLFDAYRGRKTLRIQEGAGHGGTISADPSRYRQEVRRFFLDAVN